MRKLHGLLLGICLLSVTLASGANDPDDVEMLRAQFAALQTLPPARQQQLRELDRDLHALDSESQARLAMVLANYQYWLAHLTEEDRKRVSDATTADERLKVIEKLKDREWIQTLPRAYREQYEKAEKDSDRRRMIDRWREEQRERREEWQILLRNWDDIKDNRLLPVTPAEEAFVANLEAQLPAGDLERLRRLRGAVQEDRGRLLYLRTLVELADRYPLLPGPQDGPRNYDALPKANRDALEKADRNFSKKKNFPKELQAAQGRWPDFAIAVNDYARQHRIALPESIGPVTREMLPSEVKAAVVEKLEPQLRKADSARLHEAEGKWPEYPRTVMELVKQYKVPISGWTLPGKPEVWDKFRVKILRKEKT